MPTVSNIKTSAAPPQSVLAQMKADPNRVEYETDGLGRKIGVKKLSFLDTFRITRVLGEDASNQTAYAQALLVASVVEIDGEPVRSPSSLAQLEAIMLRLDMEGVSAAATASRRFMPAPDSGEVDDIKNS